jgi:hypothetical protein
VEPATEPTLTNKHWLNQKAKNGFPGVQKPKPLQGSRQQKPFLKTNIKTFSKPNAKTKNANAETILWHP